MALTIDDIDRRIITELLIDGRLSAAEIARRSGSRVCERSVRYRIERLRRGGVMRVCAVVNPQALGYDVIGDVFIEVAAGKLRTVAKELAGFPEVSYVAASTDENISGGNGEAFGLPILCGRGRPGPGHPERRA